MIELGDIVKLKKPYKPSDLLRSSYLNYIFVPEGSKTTEPVKSWSDWQGFTYGIVVEILNKSDKGIVRNVSLHLYDPALSIIYMESNCIPTYVDFNAKDLELHKKASELGYTPVPKLTE